MNELNANQLKQLEILKRKIALLDRVIQFNAGDSYFAPLRPKIVSSRYCLVLMEKGEKEVFEFSKQIEKQFLLNPEYNLQFLGLPYLNYTGKLNYLKEVVEDVYNNLLIYPEKWINLGEIIVKKKKILGIKTWVTRSCDINIKSSVLRIKNGDEVQNSIPLDHFKLKWKGKGKEKYKFTLQSLSSPSSSSSSSSMTNNSEQKSPQTTKANSEQIQQPQQNEKNSQIIVLGSLKQNEALTLFTVLNLFVEKGTKLKTTIYSKEQLNAQASLEQRRVFFLSASQNFLLNLLLKESLYSSFVSRNTYRQSVKTTSNIMSSRTSCGAEFEKIFTTAVDIGFRDREEYQNLDVMESFQIVGELENSNYFGDQENSPNQFNKVIVSQEEGNQTTTTTANTNYFSDFRDQSYQTSDKELETGDMKQQMDAAQQSENLAKQVIKRTQLLDLNPIKEEIQISESSIGSRNNSTMQLMQAQNSPNPDTLIPFIQQQQEQQTKSSKQETKQQQETNLKTKDPLIVKELAEIQIDLPFQLDIEYDSVGGSETKGVTKTNQDCSILKKNFTNKNDRIFIGVFDGHGPQGDIISQFVRDRLAQNLEKAISTISRLSMTHEQYFLKMIIKTQKIFLNTQKELLSAAPEIDCKMSGSTALGIMFDGNNIFCMNLGDSRAIMVQKNIHFDKQIKEGLNSKQYIAQLLTREQRPNNFYEYLRIISNGGQVFQENRNNPFRVVHPEYGFGLLMSRSFGDRLMSEVGVVSLPEISCHQITELDQFLIIGSDGLWEHFTNYQFISMVMPFYIKRDPKGAVKHLISETRKLWYQHEKRIDDVTCVLVFFYDQMKSNNNNKQQEME